MSKKSILFALSLLLAYSLSGCDSIAGVFATPTPTATNTPTSTPTPLPTFTPTPTPTYTPTPEPATYQEELPDGSVLFVDRELGYRFVIPPGWVILNLTEEDVSEIITLAGEMFPLIGEYLEEIEPFLGPGLRVLVIDPNPEHFQDGFPNINIVVDDSEPQKSMSVDMFMLRYVAALPELIPGIEIISWDLGENKVGVKYGEILYILPQIKGVTEQAAKQMQSVIKINSNLIFITFTAPENVYSEVEANFGEVLDSFEVIVD